MQMLLLDTRSAPGCLIAPAAWLPPHSPLSHVHRSQPLAHVADAGPPACCC